MAVIFVLNAGNAGIRGMSTIWRTPLPDINAARLFVTSVRPSLAEFLGQVAGTQWSKISARPVTVKSEGTEFQAWELNLPLPSTRQHKDEKEADRLTAARQHISYLETEMGSRGFIPISTLPPSRYSRE